MLAEFLEQDHGQQRGTGPTARGDVERRLIFSHSRQVDGFRGTLLKRLAPEDQLVLDSESIIDGDTARKAVRRLRAEPVEARPDGQFIILTVESGVIRGGFRIRVRNTANSQEFTVKVPEGTLSEDQVETLQDGEWGKRPLMMRLNVKKSGERITEATLIEAGLTD
ncbi:MAG: hypothetical protein FD119_3521 [Stygiobacter sp.]|nr:MAG: hypothetical protein FD119_3521 [Stygiobacter sp.]